MTTLWSFVIHHRLSILLIAGALVAIGYVYKHKDKLMPSKK
jgi:hypothetical protein